jgi:hypothetical protein
MPSRYDSIVSVEDVMEGIQHLTTDKGGSEKSSGSGDNSLHHQVSMVMSKSQNEKKQHTMMSRWSKLKTMVGVKAPQLFSVVTTTAQDFDR